MEDRMETVAALEDLAGLVMGIQAGDRAGIDTCLTALDRLTRALAEPLPKTLVEALTRVRERLEGLAGKGPDEATDPVLEELEELQDLVEMHLSGALETDPAPNGLVLPPWVDKALFQDFLAGQDLVMEEVEAEIMAHERGDGEALRRLRGKLHTLKGEAGLLGLEQLEHLCHQVEDFLESHRLDAADLDRLLAVKDWMMAAVEAYRQGQLPTSDPACILQNLRDVAIPATADTTNRVTVDSPTTGAGDQPPTGMDQTTGTGASRADSAPEPAHVPSVLATWDEDTIGILVDFLAETEEGICKVDEILLAAEQVGIAPDQVDALFRVFHTIKGVAGFLDLAEIQELAHTTETLLDKARRGELEITGPALDLVFDSTAILRRMVTDLTDAVAAGHHPKPEPGLPALLTRLEAAIRDCTIPPPPATPAPDQAAPEQAQEPAPAAPAASATTTDPPSQEGGAGAAGKEGKATRIKEVVKVDLERVDNLVSLIGELVIVEAMISNATELSSSTSPWLAKQLGQMSKITGDLQDLGMSMRMVPVRGVFQKMARMVRDLSRKNGKSIAAEMRGEGTEMDRSVVELIADPLVHMIRNAVDHGIEGQEDRRRAGKPEQGRISLQAFHQGGNVVIQVTDDGRGLNREAILTKAEEKGIIKSREGLTDLEIYNLIFAPGFSTAQTVTEISGRGVGMDVVKRNIEAARGRVMIDSNPGRGSTFTMVLPLTTAIIDGMLTSVGDETYIIPTLSIIQSFKPKPGDISTVKGGGEIVQFRGGLLPMFHMWQIFNSKPALDSVYDSTVVVVDAGGRHAARVVDRLLGQRQTVIKSVTDSLGRVPGVSGVSIMADGRPGLILDVEGVVQLATEQVGGPGSDRGAHPRQRTGPDRTDQTEEDSHPEALEDGADLQHEEAGPAVALSTH